MYIIVNTDAQYTFNNILANCMLNKAMWCYCFVTDFVLLRHLSFSIVYFLSSLSISHGPSFIVCVI